MAGRGVDIKLGGNPQTKEAYEDVKQLGGLFVLGTERHEARRIDNQLRGRAGRQGDPGETQFFISLDDHLMRVFGNNDMIRNIMAKATQSEDEPFEFGMISKQIEGAQKRIEGFNFDARKRILAYDDVMNHQRQSVYDERRRYLMGDRAAIDAFLDEVAANNDTLTQVREEKKKLLGDDEYYAGVRRILMQTIDYFWLEHLEVMEYLRSSVNLRAYGQRDPLIEYRKEGLRMYRSFEGAIREKVGEMLPQLGVGAFESEEARMKRESARAQQAGARMTEGGTAPAPIRSEVKVGRNDLVRITNGTETKEIKYKKAEPLLATGEWKLVA
jgi:preprotein translocase subunit SecA